MNKIKIIFTFYIFFGGPKKNFFFGTSTLKLHLKITKFIFRVKNVHDKMCMTYFRFDDL